MRSSGSSPGQELWRVDKQTRNPLLCEGNWVAVEASEVAFDTEHHIPG